MFFDTQKLAPRKKAVIKELPPVPETGWTRPTYFPNLIGNVKVVALDVETKEPDFDYGPGWSRGLGHIVGVSLAVIGHDNSHGSWYFPVRHEVDSGNNIDPGRCFLWLESVLNTPHIPKVGANLIYDIGWLQEEGVNVTGELHDVQFAEALLTENSPTDLEHLGQKYCNEGKESNVLYDWCSKAYGGAPDSKQRANIYRAPPSLVGLYAQSDVNLPLQIIEQQWPIMAKEELHTVYRMENDLIPLMVAMRRTGVRVDLEAAEKLHGELAQDIANLKTKFHSLTGIYPNVDKAAELAQAFDMFGLSYPLTEKTKAPSFRAGFLETVEHPIAELILEIRQHEKVRNTFIESYLLNSNINGRIHCQFHPLRGKEGGTRSGRASSSTPNLQNIPTRTELGHRVRKLFIPDEGDLCWESADYSQIEYRMMAHFAVGRGSDGVRQQYNENPKTDYHDLTHDLVYDMTGQDIERKPIKTINFGLLYGMGEKKLARQLGIAPGIATDLFKGYHAGNPYVKATMDWASQMAEKLGFIQTIMGRRSRFDQWEPMENARKKMEERAPALQYNAAIHKYGSKIQRAFSYKAINRILQGSAADVLKKGMLDCWNAGIFDVIGVPKIQVHDELNFSVKANNAEQRQAYEAMRIRMEQAIPTRVPVVLERERGQDWGSTVKFAQLEESQQIAWL